jgi:hypothetical protein
LSTSSSAVTLGESGTEPLGPRSISVRRPSRACSSSRKRVQSARNSSLTKSPGRSGPRAGGGWGCSAGPEITPHLGVERWISRIVLSADASALGAVGRRRRARLYAVGRGVRPPERGGCPTKSAQRAGTSSTSEAKGDPSGVGRRAERLTTTLPRGSRPRVQATPRARRPLVALSGHGDCP